MSKPDVAKQILELVLEHGALMIELCKARVDCDRKKEKAILDKAADKRIEIAVVLHRELGSREGGENAQSPMREL